MMRMRNKNDASPPRTDGGSGGGAGKEWELRPGGMVVQKRVDGEQSYAPPPTIRVRVKYGSIYHEVYVNSQATFGELKKMLFGPTGLHPEDQKLFYKDKERDSKSFLDTARVKDKSKLVLQEDPISKEKRYLEMRKSAEMEKAAKSISEISLEVDRLAGQVSALDSVISKGGKIPEKDLVKPIELLMNQLLKLDGIVADGDVALQKKMQVTRVQKYVETLDMLKIKNSMPTSDGNHKKSYSNGHISTPIQPRRDSNGSIELQQISLPLVDLPKQEEPLRRHSTPGEAVVITTKWETFDSILNAPSSSGITRPAQPSFTWDLL